MLCIFAFAIYDVMGLGFVMFRAGVFLDGACMCVGLWVGVRSFMFGALR